MTNKKPPKLITTTRRSLGRDSRGLSSVEYIILLVVIAVAGISIWTEIGSSVEQHATESLVELEGLGDSD